MKRIVLRLTVAVVAFGFGVAVDRVATSRVPAQANVEPMIATTTVPANETEAGDETDCHSATPPFPLPADAPHPIVLLDYDLAKFEPSGSYFPLQPLPKEFGDIEWFELNVNQEAGEVWGSAYVQTQADNVNDFPNAEFLLITERRVFFVTSAGKDTGYAYRFEGKFLANPTFQMDTGKAVVRGTLSKMKDGRTVAECEASFEVEYLDC
jgi:hypothetical protein